MKSITIQIILILFCGFVNAQQAFTNSGNLQIHSGGSLTGFGNFINASTGRLVDSGSFYMRGNLTNDEASMAIGTGTLYLNDTLAQSVNGAQPFRTFNLVTNNNTTAGITLNNNLSVTGAHTFTDGIINTSATPNYLIYEAGSSYSGDADDRHVNGWVKKLGSTNFAFPVGNATVIRKVSIESLSASLEFNVKYEAPTLNPLNVQPPLILVDPNEYWIINRVNAGGSAQVHLNWDDSKVNFPQYVLTAIRVGYFTGLWTDQGGSATGNVNAIGDVTSVAVSAFGNFTFASNDFLVPLQFLGVSALRKTGYNLIEWRTANATNTDHFEIERSENAVQFQKIGSTTSYNSPSVMLYSFKDVQLVSGTTLWYRIRSVDRDGDSKLSGVVSVKDLKQANQSMYVLNNPAFSSIHLFAPDSYKGVCDYYITSTNGQLMQKGVLSIKNAGNVFIKLDAGISPGVYILNVKNDKQHFQERVLVK